jgi:hypothetical protein
VSIGLQVGYTRLDTDYNSAQDVIKGAKKALDEAVKHPDLSMYEY